MGSRILIVDDCEVNVEIFEELLGDRYELAVATSGEECLEKLPEFKPELVLLDIMMPGIDGYETCRRIKAGPLGEFTQVIMVSGKAATHERVRGYEAGADDYIVKPFDHDELLAKIRVHFQLRNTIIELSNANAKIQQFNAELEVMVQQRTAEVIATRDMAVFALAKLAESRDPETGEHLLRLRMYCRMLADQLAQEGPYVGQIDERFLADLFRASPLHDIGKVGIPDAILLKPGRLSNQEFEVMKLHCAIGADALEQAARRSTFGGFLEMAVDVARHHHERFNGSGYPDGLAGRDIPLAARIVCLADVYDALTTARVYKSAYDPAVAMSMIEAERGTQFDPAVVDALRARADDFLRIASVPESEQLALLGEVPAAGAPA